MDRKALIAALLVLAAVIAVAIVRLTPAGGIAAEADPVAEDSTRAAPAMESPTVPSPTSERAVISTEIDVPEEEVSEATLVIRVVSKETRAPLGGVPIDVSWEGEPDEFGAVPLLEGPTVRTDSEGLASAAVPSGRGILLQHDAGASLEMLYKKVDPLARGERRQEEVELGTDSLVMVFGRIVSSVDKTPVAGAHIEHRTRAELLQSLESLPDGHFTLSASAFLPSELRITAEGFTPRRIGITDGHSTGDLERVIRLGPTARLEVRVTDAGLDDRGVEGVTVWLRGHAWHLQDEVSFGLWDVSEVRYGADTDASGIAVIENVASEVPLDVLIRRHESEVPLRHSLEMDLRMGDAVLHKEPRTMTLHPGESRSLEIRLGGGSTIAGTLVDQDGAPLADEEVWLDHTDDSMWGFTDSPPLETTWTGEGGWFRFENVSRGRWWVGLAYREDTDVVGAPEVVQVLPESADLTVRVVVHRGLFITGSALDPEGSPLGNAGVYARGPSFSDTESGDDGSFRVGPLTSGLHDVDGWAPETDFAPPETIEVEAGATEVVLRFRRGGRIRGRCTDESGGPVNATLILGSNAEGAPWFYTDGDIELESLAPGRYSIFGSDPLGRCDLVTGIQVEEGATTADVSLQLRPGGRVRVRYEGEEERGSIRLEHDGVLVGQELILRQMTRGFTAPVGLVVVRCEEQTREVVVVAGEEVDVSFR